MQVLDDLGDHSDTFTRQEYFQQIDVDGSGAIDFEEFLGVSCSNTILFTSQEYIS